MSTVSDVIRQSDPFSHEPMWSPEVRAGVRQKVLQDAADVEPLIRAFRQRLTVAALAVCLVIAAAVAILPRVWAPMLQAQASVRFEIRLAEASPAPGLLSIIESGSTIYLHRDAVIGNIDIASARVIARPEGFSVEVTFTPRGAEKIAAATRNHVGKPVAILIDGRVVAMPGVRSAVGSSAEINGHFTRAEADRIANGMIGR
jgi:preprotein translocase subunit SecD